MHGSIVIVDDDVEMCRMLEADLTHRGFVVAAFTSAEPALEAIQPETVHAVLTDLNMPGMGGIELCRWVAENRTDIPVIVITAFGSLDTAVAAIRAGAYDFVTKPIELETLALTLERAVRHRQLQDQVKRLTDALDKTKRFDEIIGASAPMRRLYDQMSRVADTESSILITGASGTGKEMVAKALHRRSRRHDGPFVAVNCSALPETLAESELFGHAKGAFTDARTARQGLFQQAHGGTLLLDEIGDLPLPLQPKLLRALEEGRVRPVGSEQETEVDVRLISATNRDLDEAVEQGRLREDLFFRVNVIRLHLPSLHARGTDVLLLAQHFIGSFAARAGKQVTGLSDAAARKLVDYDWPGNVRELRNAIERAVALTRLEKIAVEDLPETVQRHRKTDLLIEGGDPSSLLPLEHVEARYIQHVLRVTGGNKTTAAQILGLDRKTLYRKLQRLEDHDSTE